MASSRPRSREEFEVAVICALPLEYDAVILLVDEFWDENGDIYGRARGDNNTYTTGRIGHHNVVIALLPGMGKVHAAYTVAGLRSSYTNIRLALVTGICGGVPVVGNTKEMLLGDVVISDRVVQYDFGRLYPHGFTTKTTTQDSFGRSSADIRGLLAVLQTEIGLQRLQQRTSLFLQLVQHKASATGRSGFYDYPGTHADNLFDSDYIHKHQGFCNCICSRWQCPDDPICENAVGSLCLTTGCSTKKLLPRRRLTLRQRLEAQGVLTNIQEPLVFLGGVASGDTVMKSGTNRDQVAEAQNIIAFEMEGSGVWEELPSLIIKGVCDYADSHKDKRWQNFAAATAAAAMRAVLQRYSQTDGILGSELRTDLSATIAPPRSSMCIGEHWQRTLVRHALSYLPKELRGILAEMTASKPLITNWTRGIIEWVKARPDTPEWLCHTAPYKRFVSGTERLIRYECVDSVDIFGESVSSELEDIPLSLLGDLEKYDTWKREEQRERERERAITENERKRTGGESNRTEPPSSVLSDPEASQSGFFGGEVNESSRKNRKRLYLFYSASHNTEPTDELDLPPFQSMLWSFVTQVLVWQSRLMGVYLGWLGAVKPELDHLETVPTTDRLKTFLPYLLECLGIPVVITVCHIDNISDLHDPQSIRFLAELGSSNARLGIQVHVILSTVKEVALPSEIRMFQCLSRNTERDACLDDFQFEGQFVRRDEVSAADEGTKTWIWNHPTFVSWINEPSGILWIEGKAGSGKSVLAKTIRFQFAARWSTNWKNAPLPQLSDWFYSSRHGDLTRSHFSFMRSILAQILEQSQHAFSSYAPEYRDKMKENKEWTLDDYERILTTLAAQGLPAICIVDALDESEIGADQSANLREHVIQLLARLVDAPSSHLRILVLSRYTPDIDRSFSRWSKRGGKLSHISLEEENSADIACLVDHGLATLSIAMKDFDSDSESEIEDLGPSYLSRTTPVSREPSIDSFNRMRNYLNTNAQGVMLWVKLAIQALVERVRGGWYNERLLEVDLQALPRDLSHFYKLIVQDLESKYPGQWERAREALMWVVGATAVRPLALGEMYEALCIPAQHRIEPDSLDDPLIQGESSIRAKTWKGFYRQLRAR
ncbi:5'-methylthioadenosine/S-adenosylhomocysteine nucleosidase [Fusarium oxysporum f. sp. cubense]|uniref:5'-methylthioadenosine/S-adenosylhomocysteine nucleosidase n=1 Tax=Fusarium oxysporum f. sp. cubense TaxID=61366 RepID=A0A559KYV6_FUSOC|nr:5'-methylthioadenosine/S-adenosylhomocysteine nucleosidase [Fusarium oxysporum f. sp. cubense]